MNQRKLSRYIMGRIVSSGGIERNLKKPVMEGYIAMEELKKKIIDMVNGLEDEHLTKLLYYYVKHLTIRAEGGENHEGNRKEDLPVAGLSGIQ